MVATTSVVDGSDGVIAALDDLSAAVKENVKDERLLLRRISQLRARRAKGGSWHELLAGEQSPGVLGLVAQVHRRLTDSSSTLRRAVARAIRAEGETIPTIARLFGVSHQRISALLRRRDRPPT